MNKEAIEETMKGIRGVAGPWVHGYTFVEVTVEDEHVFVTVGGGPDVHVRHQLFHEVWIYVTRHSPLAALDWDMELHLRVDPN